MITAVVYCISNATQLPELRYFDIYASSTTNSTADAAILFNPMFFCRGGAKFTRLPFTLNISGRAYIGQSEVMMKQLIKCLKCESKWTKRGENLLGAMQKLSLRYAKVISPCINVFIRGSVTKLFKYG